jgi:hypothetical protein
VVSLLPASAGQIITHNDTARFLAGLIPSAESPLTPLTKDAAWARHARALDQAWARLDKTQLSRIRVWTKKYLPEHRKLMLYMFSGPDFLYADAFYPHAETYVLAAKEPIGPVPDAASLSGSSRSRELQSLRASMQTVLNYSFFITKDMKGDLRTGKLRGTLPLLYVFLARSGKTIHQVSLVRLEPDGSIVAPSGTAAKGSSAGVKIVFSAGQEDRRRTLYYFRTDLSNGGLKITGFTKFCEAQGAADSLIKSASYLLHGNWFSMARDFLLKQSAVLIQDDSGIPLRHFGKQEWALHPFGQYLGPISIFAKHYQRDMKTLFDKGRARKIDFGIGYKWRSHQTNLLLAVKKQPAVESATTDPVDKNR